MTAADAILLAMAIVLLAVVAHDELRRRRRRKASTGTYRIPVTVDTLASDPAALELLTDWFRSGQPAGYVMDMRQVEGVGFTYGGSPRQYIQLAIAGIGEDMEGIAWDWPV